ncbi:hypothetical protein [Streptomyces alkaliterrae]|uniref:Uncharacterized protein n=1 Tax=Streptomyces alkaliterrae TaxID=2213162 RepID=A0A5P0YQT3_9ACTN|nr:hypothetical protein [Streptomyces alkaliterrae]MBB1256961.1 hypothetical protein [Streptomyces alkaliterrae]MBB1258950.1 hypothetical protein [Streptomyces alkaliterrae]MQS02673.1 hypothetical protein [Streptomyces alkaliterrae]
MRSVRQHGDSEPRDAVSGSDVPEDAEFEEALDLHRVRCPECSRPIALFAEEEVLPQHAVCASPWDPFGLTVCAGSGVAVAEAEPAAEPAGEGSDMAALLTLPAGLDWRTQPFSHAGVGRAAVRPAA